MRIFNWFLLLIFTGLALAEQQCGKNKIDIVLVYEQRTRQPQSEILNLKKLVNQLYKEKETNGSCVKLSLLTIADQANVVMPLNCNRLCLTKVNTRLEQMGTRAGSSKEGYKGSLAKTLRSLKDVVFSPKVGGRKDAKKRVVLFLTSEKDESIELHKEVENLHKENRYSFIVVGLGQARNEDLFKIATAEHRILVLRTIEELLEGKAGHKVLIDLLNNPEYDRYLKENIPTADPGCRFVADIGFLIDASDSIRIDYLAELQFVQYLAASFGLSEKGTHAGAIVFSDLGRYTSLQFDFKNKTYHDLTNFARTVERFPFYGYRTRIDLALEIADKQLFTKKAGMRQDVNKVIFLLTDGTQNPKKSVSNKVYDAVKAAKRLMDRGINIFVIGVGPKTDRAELERLAGSSDRVYMASKATDLAAESFIRKIAKKTCKEVVIKATTATKKTTKIANMSTTTPKKTAVTTPKTTTKATTPKTTTVTTPKTTKATTPKTTKATTPKTTKAATPKTTKATTPKTTKVAATKTTTTPAKIEEPTKNCTPSPCKGVGKCGSCCGGRNIYINIFQKDSAPLYLIQGLQISKRKNQSNVISTILPCLPNDVDTVDLKLSNDDIMETIKKKFPGQDELYKNLMSILHTFENTKQNNNNFKRHKRSLVEDVPESFKQIKLLASTAGCRVFFNDFDRLKMWDLINWNSEKNGKKHVTIFCPINTQYMKVRPTILNQRDFLSYHVGIVNGNNLILISLLNRQNIVMKEIRSTSGMASMKVEDANVLLTLSSGPYFTICIIDKVLQPPLLSLIEAMEKSTDLKVSTELFQKSNIRKILRKIYAPKKVCFESELCLPVASDLRKHFKHLLTSNLFTVQVLNDKAFNGMTQNVVKRLKINPTRFILQHIFLGVLDHEIQENSTRILAVSGLKKHPVSEMTWDGGRKIVLYPNGKVYEVERSIRVKEGFLQVLKSVE